MASSSDESLLGDDDALLARARENDPHVKSFSFQGRNDTFEESFLMDLAHVLEINTVAKTMGFMDIRFPQTQASVHMFAALAKNTALEMVSIIGCVLDQETLHALLTALSVNTTVTEFRFGGVLLPPGASAAAELLKKNATLTLIDFEHTQLGDEGARLLSEGLAVNQSVLEINLSNNEITVVGIRAIAEALKINTTLTSIDLGENEMGAEGARCLGDMLQMNSTLLKLSLYSCELGDVGGQALAEALALNSSLNFLSIWHNDLSSISGEAFRKALTTNFSLQQLDLDLNGKIDSSIRAEIKSLLSDPVRAAWASGEADTKPACEIPLEKRE
eukprot:m.129352 g.129352  ORF g.129352 m.129352 type:complete len:332 (+) comp14753_c1_seq7:11-1006(+)